MLCTSVEVAIASTGALITGLGGLGTERLGLLLLFDIGL